YFVARRLFSRASIAWLATALLALAPAHFILGRVAMDYLYPAPFVLGWLLCLAAYLESNRRAVLFAGTSLLGIAMYSYLAAVIMMPLYLLVTVAAVWHERRLNRATAAAAIGGFAWPLTLMVIWLPAHPVFRATMDRYAFSRSPREALHFFAIT